MDKQCLYLCRLLPIPLLFFVLGQFFEGPPYRVIVRGVPFILAGFTLALCAAQFLRQWRNLPLWVSLLQGIGVPLGFIIAAQGYYDGGKNQEYAVVFGIFGILMLLNGGLYLIGFFIRNKETEMKSPSEETDPGTSCYKIELRHLNTDGTTGGVKYRDEGTKELPEWIILDGFERDQGIELQEYWDLMRAEGLTEFQTEVTVRETIVKFGDTMQLVDNYRLLLHYSFC